MNPAETRANQLSQAKALKRKLESIYRDLKKIPSYKGKAAFADKVIAANTLAEYLAFSLKNDHC
jgi:hypothetical protein